MLHSSSCISKHILHSSILRSNPSSSTLRSFVPNVSSRRFIHLHSVTHPQTPPSETPLRAPLVLLHGLLGNTANLKSLSSSLTAHLPTPSSSLILDTRGHGKSPAHELAGDPPTPATLPNCGRDVANTLHTLTGGAGADVIVGHSFGGKQSLAFLLDIITYNTLPPPSHVWLLDTIPTAVDRDKATGRDSVKDVIDAVASIEVIESKKHLVAQLSEKNIPQSIAMWMTTNLRPNPDTATGGFVFAFDVPTIRSLYDSYTVSDYSQFLKDLTGPTTVHLVRATKNDAWKGVAGAIAAIEKNEWVKVHDIDAGHWVHVEKRDELAALIKPTLRSVSLKGSLPFR